MKKNHNTSLGLEDHLELISLVEALVLILSLLVPCQKRKKLMITELGGGQKRLILVNKKKRRGYIQNKVRCI